MTEISHLPGVKNINIILSDGTVQNLEKWVEEVTKGWKEQTKKERKRKDKRNRGPIFSLKYANMPDEIAFKHVLRSLISYPKAKIDNPYLQLPLKYLSKELLKAMLAHIEHGIDFIQKDDFRALQLKYERIQNASGLILLFHYALHINSALLSAEMYTIYTSEYLSVEAKFDEMSVDSSIDEEILAIAIRRLKRKRTHEDVEKITIVIKDDPKDDNPKDENKKRDADRITIVIDDD